MKLSLIVAVDEDGCIGYAGGLPWRLRTDLQRFKALTMGHHLIVGRRTWESIGRALPGRQMIVVSRSLSQPPAGVTLAATLPQALAQAQAAGESEAFIGGGAVLFAAALPLADRIYLTRVHTRVTCDTHMPAFDPHAWRVVSQTPHPAGEADQFPFTDFVLERA